MSDSDDEQVVIVKKAKHVYYGSLEEQERQRILAENQNPPIQDAEAEDQSAMDLDEEMRRRKTMSEAVRAGIATGNINISEEYMDIEAHVNREKQTLLEEFEKRKKARDIKVSTDDTEIRQDLRALGEPICLFGEGPGDRRERLRQVLVRLGEDALQRNKVKEIEQKAIDKDSETTWYHEGSENLRQSRYFLARFSLPRARQRLANARREKGVPDSIRNAKRQDLHKRLRNLSISSSQIGDNRPVSFCRFSPNSKLLATASWSGLCKLWSVPDCGLVRVLRGHANNVGAIVFHPQATLSMDEAACNMASCGHDGAVKFWNLLSDEPIATIDACIPNRVSRLEYHPSGRFLALCVHDKSWRLWDLEVQEEVLHQEGHSKAVYDIAFQSDGSLAVTGGMDAYGRVWDLRSGRCVMFLEGHLREILGVDFNPNGFHVATGSADNSCKIWDLRKRDQIYTIPAHKNLVSTVKFEPQNGGYLVTSSYDNTIGIWGHPGWAPMKTLEGHDSKVMSVDVSGDGAFIASGSYDRTFKLWTPDL